MHSAKALPSATFGKDHLTKKKKIVGKDLFAECHLSSTRQRKDTITAVPPALPSGSTGFAECLPAGHSAKKKLKKKIFF